MKILLTGAGWAAENALWPKLGEVVDATFIPEVGHWVFTYETVHGALEFFADTRSIYSARVADPEAAA